MPRRDPKDIKQGKYLDVLGTGWGAMQQAIANES